jgi:hypothetical protein
MAQQQIERRLVTGFAIGHDIADDYLGPQQGRRTVVRSQLKAFFETLLAAPPTAVAMAPACESPKEQNRLPAGQRAVSLLPPKRGSSRPPPK